MENYVAKTMYSILLHFCYIFFRVANLLQVNRYDDFELSSPMKLESLVILFILAVS